MNEKPNNPGEFFWEDLLDTSLGEETQKHIDEQLRALAANPLDPRPYFHLGLLYKMQGKPEKAIEVLERALGLDPDFHLAHQHLGAIHAALGDYGRAWLHAREAAARGNTTLLDLLNRYPEASRPRE